MAGNGRSDPRHGTREGYEEHECRCDRCAAFEVQRVRSLATISAGRRDKARRQNLQRLAELPTKAQSPRLELGWSALQATAAGQQPDPDLVRLVTELVDKANS